MFSSDILYYISLFLRLTDIFTLQRVNKHFYKCLNEDRVIEAVIKRYFPRLSTPVMSMTKNSLKEEMIPKWNSTRLTTFGRDAIIFSIDKKQVQRKGNRGLFPMVKTLEPLVMKSVSIKILDHKERTNYTSFGLITRDVFSTLNGVDVVGTYPDSFGYCTHFHQNDGYLLMGNASQIPAETFTIGDIISLILDENYQLSFYKNGIQQSKTLTIPKNDYYVAVSLSTDCKVELL